MQSFMHGFKDNEYHLDMVEHTDTDHLHYHARIPKINLLTNTQLKLYYHKTDLSYKKAVIDDICQRHGLVTGQEMKRAMPNSMEKLERVEKWREEHGQKALNLSTPKIKRATEKKVSDYIAEGVRAGLFNTLNDVENELGILGVNIVNKGYDKGKQFHYLTIENESGKMRVKGDIYSAEFYQLTREDRSKSVSNNKSIATRDDDVGAGGKDVKHTLQRERIKRFKFIEKQYGNARKRAYQREDEASIKADRKEEQRDIRRLGEGYAQYTKEPNRGSSADGRRRAEDIKEDAKTLKGDIRGDRKAKKAIAQDNDKNGDYSSSSIHCFSRRDRNSMVFHTNTTNTNTTNDNAQAERDKLRGSKSVDRSALLHEEDREWIYIGKERILDDPIRANINQAIKDAAGSIYPRVEGDHKLLSKEYGISSERDREAEQDVKALRESVHELADKHQSRTTGRFGEGAEREGAVIRKVYAGIEREFNETIGRIGEKAGELEQSRQGFVGEIKRCIKKIINRVKEVIAPTPIEFKKGFSPS
jgi:hypothetical protein